MRFFLVFTTILFFSLQSIAQKQHYLLSDGLVAKGYDVVAYFDNKALKGKSNLTHEYEGLKFQFANTEHLAKFKENPTKYLPQYGGYCAYAMAVKGEKVNVDPKTFEIRDGKLYLFYNAFFTNTLDSWKKENPEKLRPKADNNWAKIIAID